MFIYSVHFVQQSTISTTVVRLIGYKIIIIIRYFKKFSNAVIGSYSGAGGTGSQTVTDGSKSGFESTESRSLTQQVAVSSKSGCGRAEPSSANDAQEV